MQFWKQRLISIWRQQSQHTRRQPGADQQDGPPARAATTEEAQLALTKLFGDWELYSNPPLLIGVQTPKNRPQADEPLVQEQRIGQLLALGPLALGPLTECLRAERATAQDFRRAVLAALALGRLGDLGAAPALLAALRDERSGAAPVRAAAATALGHLKAEAAARLYAQAATTPGEDWQAEAAQLSTLRTETLIEALIVALRDSAPPVRAASAAAFLELSLGDLPGDLRPAPRPTPAGIHALPTAQAVRNGQPAQAALRAALEPLAKALTDSDLRVRVAAATALGWLGDARAASALIRALQDPHPECRGAAALALGLLGAPAALRPLARAMGDQSVTVRQQAAESLGQIADPVATPLLLDVVADEDERLEVRAAAARSAGRLRSPHALPPLVDLLDAPEPVLRAAGIEALGYLGFGRVYRLLTPFLWREPDRAVRHSAARAIARLALARETGTRWRLRLALRVDRQVRQEALSLLGQYTRPTE